MMKGSEMKINIKNGRNETSIDITGRKERMANGGHRRARRKEAGRKEGREEKFDRNRKKVDR